MYPTAARIEGIDTRNAVGNRFAEKLPDRVGADEDGHAR